MSLLIYQLPKELKSRIERLKTIIEDQEKELSMIENLDVRREQGARVAVCKGFLDFLESSEKDEFVKIFPMNSEGAGSSANQLILVDMLSKPKGASRLEDRKLKKEIISGIYKKGDPSASNAYFITTAEPAVFEWWEESKEKSGDILKGLVKTQRKI